MTYTKHFLATMQLVMYLGISLSEDDVYLVKPLKGTKCEHLIVYGVAIREEVTNAIKVVLYWPRPYMDGGMFRSIKINNDNIKVRQDGDVTLVGNKNFTAHLTKCFVVGLNPK